MVDDKIREVTRPESDAPASAKPAARNRLLAAIEADPGRLPEKRKRLRGRGLAAMIAVLVLPTGVALATELGKDGEQSLISPSDCPELLAGLENGGLGTEGLVLTDCPVGPEVDQIIADLQRLGELESDEAAVVLGFGRAEDGKAWGLAGLAGEAKPEP